MTDDQLGLRFKAYHPASVDAAHLAAIDAYERRIVRLSHKEELLKEGIQASYLAFSKAFTERTMLEERRDEFLGQLADLAAQLRGRA